MNKLSIEVETFRFNVSDKKLQQKVATFLANEGYEYERKDTLFEVYSDFDLCQLQISLSKLLYKNY